MPSDSTQAEYVNEDPTQIGRYQVVSVLGRGAMGVVYQAQDPEIDRAVAIKLVHAFLLSGDEQAAFISRFRREAQAAARCAHPNVVAVYDFALHNGNPFLAMEFVNGKTLSGIRQATQRMSPAAAIHIINQILAGLGAAHASGITHRDVKPSNIMLSRTGAAKIGDFGISRLESSSLTSAGMMVGTPSYMSPEQCRGDTVDGRSDLYSTGVVLYELLSGTRPFAGTTSGALYVRLLSEDAPDIRERAPDISAPIADILARSLSRDPDQRYPTAEAMADALRVAIGQAPLTIDPPQTDQTVIMADRLADAQAAGPVDPELLATLERRLAEHLGPIARYLVQSALRRTSDFDSLWSTLAENIEQPAARESFARNMRQTASATGSASRAAKSPSLVPVVAPTLDAASLDTLQSALAHYVGPLARVMIKRAKSTDLHGLWQEMASHIDDPAARAAFLQAAP